MRILTIDIGGTAIKSGIGNQRGELVKQFEPQKTAISSNDNRIVEQVGDICRHALKSDTLAGVAIASAGVVNAEKGEIIFAGPTIPNYAGNNFKKYFAHTFGLSCEVENDVNAMALGECWLGAGRGCQSALCLTLGTGLGGAIVLEGKLWRGGNFSAGEMGYFPVSGKRRLEQAASTTALLENYQQLSGENIDGKTFFARLRTNDAMAQAALMQMLNYLVLGLLPAVYLLAPERLIIGGGIAAQDDILIPRINQLLATEIADKRFMPQRICAASLGNQAAMVGALQHFLHKQKR